LEEGLTKVGVTAREAVVFGEADSEPVITPEAEGEEVTEGEKEEEEVPDWEGTTPLTLGEGDTKLETEVRAEREGEEDRDWDSVEEMLAEVERDGTRDWVPKVDWVFVRQVVGVCDPAPPELAERVREAAEEALGLPLGWEAVEDGVAEGVMGESRVAVMGAVFEVVALGLEAVEDTE
jgi:hypothetical protein